VLRDFHDLWAGKIQQQDQRRDAAALDGACAIPRLSHSCRVSSATTGSAISRNCGGLEPMIEDAAFCAEWRDIKRSNKSALAAIIRERNRCRGSTRCDLRRARQADPRNTNASPEIILHVIRAVSPLKTDPTLEIHPRVFIFGGKAAPSYHLAK